MEVIKIGTDWFVKIECPKPIMTAKSREEHIKMCAECPYAMWKTLEPVAGFMSSMCGIRVGSIGMAAALDEIGERLTGMKRFTKTGTWSFAPSTKQPTTSMSS